MSKLKVNTITVYDNGDDQLAVDSHVKIGVASTKNLIVSGTTELSQTVTCASNLDVKGNLDMQPAGDSAAGNISNAGTVDCSSVTASSSITAAGVTSSNGLSASSGNLQITAGNATINKTLLLQHSDGPSGDALTVTQGDIEASNSTIKLDKLQFGTATYSAADFVNFASTDLIKGCATLDYDMSNSDGTTVTILNGTGFSSARYEHSSNDKGIKFSFTNALANANYMVFVSGTQGQLEGISDDKQHVWQVFARTTADFTVDLVNANGNETGHVSVLVLQVSG